MNNLLIGGAGFLGRHLQTVLEARGETVRVVDPKLNCTFVEWRYKHAASDYDRVFHLGANILDIDSRSRQGVDAYQDLVLDYDVLRWVEGAPPKQCFVAFSSVAVYDPDFPYGHVKRTLERMCARLKSRVVLLRPASVYGADQSEDYPFRAILERAKRREDPLQLWGWAECRDFLHVDDAVEGILGMAEHGPSNSPIELGTGYATPMNKLARLIATELGYSPVTVTTPGKATGAHYLAANPAAANRLGWRAKITLQEGIRKCLST